MQPDRRDFLRHLSCVTGVGLLGVQASPASEHANAATYDETTSVLVDLTLCIGCRLCEHACKQANGIDPGPVEAYDDQSVFATQRRPTPDAFTVMNAWADPRVATKQIYVKSNCLHCNQPACVSACIVGALRKTDGGPVTYDAWKCIGCRYCMVACPFQIPTYDYDNAFTPQVRKCELCHESLREGELPACVAACPRETMVVGPRAELLALAHEKIADHPDQYVDHIYGEHEVGGTSWLYLSSVPFEEIGFLQLPSDVPSRRTESIQHGIFKYGVPPLLLYGLLGGMMYLTRGRDADTDAGGAEAIDGELDAIQAPPLPDEAGAFAPRAALLAEQPDQRPLSSPTDLPAFQTADPPSTQAAAHANEHDHGEPRPVDRKFFTPGVMIMLGVVLTGLLFGLKRFAFGMASTTNLNDQFPWGLWICVDVESGVALAAGGFTSAFLIEVLHRKRYHSLMRPALLAAMLGYTFVVIGLQADLGRYYNVWHPLIMWQGNSVLFEVGMCVMCYLTVLYLEFSPVVCERLGEADAAARFPRLNRLAGMFYAKVRRVMFLLIIAGCVLSCLHQSALGTLMIIAPSKSHPLWWSPFLSLQFLLSAIAVGFPIVIWQTLVASWALKLKPEMDVIGPLGRFVPFTLGVYLAVKVADMIWRGSYAYLGDGSLQSACWMAEVGFGVVLPIAMFSSARVRRSPSLLLTAASLVVAGIVFNRINVFIIGYFPPYATERYVPAFGEFAVTLGLFAALMLVYRLAVTHFSVISQPRLKVAA